MSGEGVICLDEQGAKMPLDDWRKAHRARGHVPIFSHKGHYFCVQTYWVGICGKNEDPPRPFLVEYERLGDDGKPRQRSYWCASYEAAAERHAKCCEEIKKLKLR